LGLFSGFIGKGQTPDIIFQAGAARDSQKKTLRLSNYDIFLLGREPTSN
jgi:hypothetical protein